MNNSKKKNLNGFTLVELIVVVSIFGMIMVAILNFIKPANELHNDTQATMDANLISSGLIEYVDDELRYATNILILEDYRGVPQVSDKGIVAKGKDIPSIAFTNCLVLDNVNLRGYALSDYSGDDTDRVDKRMGATGCIYKITKLDEEGLNFNNAIVAKGVDFYDKFKFEMSADSNRNYTDNRANKNLQAMFFNVKTYSAVYNNGTYEFTKKRFERDTVNNVDATIRKESGAAINFTNINDAGRDDWAVRDFEFGNEMSENIFDKYVDRASAPIGCTPQQAKYYEDGEENRYTYIFYQKKKSANKCTLKFIYSDSSPISPGADVADPVEIVKGSKFKLFPSTPSAPAGYNAPYWVGPDGNKVDTSAGVVVNDDMTFVLVFTEKTPDANQAKLTWLDESGSVYKTTFESKSAPGSFHAAIEPSNPYDGAMYDCEWQEQGTGAKCSTVNIDGPKTFVAVKIPKIKVTFSTNGTDVDSEMYVSKGTKLTEDTLPSAMPEKIPAGKMFVKWVIDGKESQKIEDYAITAATKFKCEFKDKPPIPAGSSVVKIHVKKILSWNNNATVTCSNQAADFSVSGDATVARHKENHYGNLLVNQLGNNKNFEFTFYTPDVTIQLQWAGARKFENNGSIYEVWYKDGAFYDTDPG